MDEEKGTGIWERKRIKSLRSLVTTFACHYQTAHLYHIAKMLGTEKRLWEVLVQNLYEELAEEVEFLTLEDVEEELRFDDTGEYEELTKIEIK